MTSIPGAAEWIDTELEGHGLRRTGAIEEPRVYPWSTVWRIPTIDGSVWFKAPAQACRHEVGVTQLVAAVRPDVSPGLVAADVRRGWLLMRDAGTSVRAVIRQTRDLGPWSKVLPLYADLQATLAAKVPALLAIGTPDHRLASLPTIYEDLGGDREATRIGLTPGLTKAEHDRLRDLAPQVGDICARLAVHGIPESLHHGDLHDGNVLAHKDRVAFIDWGDAALTHPFVSLRTVFVSIGISLQLDDYAFTPEMAGLRDLYLGRWEAYGSIEQLRDAARLAALVAPIVGASGWRRALRAAAPEQMVLYAHAVPELLREFLTLVVREPQR